MALALAAVACGTSDDLCAVDVDFPASPSATAADVQPILAHNCAVGGCHLSAPGAGGLVLAVASPTWPDALIGVPAHENPAMDLVAAGDPDRSWLVRKLAGSFCGVSCDPALGCGAAMPFGTPLSDADRGTVAAWVLAGAPEAW